MLSLCISEVKRRSPNRVIDRLKIPTDPSFSYTLVYPICEVIFEHGLSVTGLGPSFLLWFLPPHPAKKIAPSMSSLITNTSSVPNLEFIVQSNAPSPSYISRLRRCFSAPDLLFPSSFGQTTNISDLVHGPNMFEGLHVSESDSSPTTNQQLGLDLGRRQLQPHATRVQLPLERGLDFGTRECCQLESVFDNEETLTREPLQLGNNFNLKLSQIESRATAV